MRRFSVLVSGLSRLARPLICLFVVATMLAVPDISTLAAANAPLRTFWVARSSLDSPDAVRRAVAAAADGAFDTIMVPVSLVGDALQTFDGGREIVNEARARGLRVHAWIEVTLAAASGQLPASRDHVIYQHPEWLMVPRELAPEMLKVDFRNPAYLGRLSRWARANPSRVEGVYLSPLAPEASAYLVTAVTAAARRYPVDGVFLDAVRFPGVDFDYSRHAMEVFRSETRLQLTLEERARLDDVEVIDPFGYADELPDRWRTFRQSRLTNLISRLRQSLSTVNPTLIVSAGVAPDPGSALADSFQDWTSWMEAGFVDGIGRRSGTSGTIVFTADALSGAGSSAGGPTGDTGVNR